MEISFKNLPSHIKIIEGNLFNSKAQTLVNTVNTEGVMGKGLALEFRLRYPDMFKKYAKLCKEGKFRVGELWLFKTNTRWILNFPTKKAWRDDSKIEYLEVGLKKFINTYKEKNIQTIAFPVLGANLGNLDPNLSLEIMIHYLSNCDIPIEIYKYDPNSVDDIYNNLKEDLLNLNDYDFQIIFGLGFDKINMIRKCLSNESIRNTYEFIHSLKINIKQLIRIFDYFFDRYYEMDYNNLSIEILYKLKLNLSDSQLKKIKFLLLNNKLNQQALKILDYILSEVFLHKS
ncbi:MAG: macro domain-containing protein [Ignavibacteria bacterium]